MSKMSAFRMLIGNSSNKCIQENVDYTAPDFSNGAPARPPLCPIQESGQKQLADLSGFEHSTPRGKTDASLTPKEKKSSMLTQAGVAFCMYAENDDGNGNGATPEKQVTHANRKFSWYQKHQKQHSSLAEDALHTGRKSPSSFKQENGSSEAQGTPSRPPSNLTGHHSLQTLATNKHGGAIQYSTPRASRIEVKSVQSTYELGHNSQTLNVTPRKSVSRTLKYGQSGCVNGLSNEGSASVVSKQLGARNTVIRSLGFSQPKIFPQQLIPYCSVPHYELEEDLSFWQEHNVQVLIRTRPLNSTEIAVQGYNRCIKQDSAHSLTWTAQPEARFTFDHVACETITQAKLFNVAGLPMVENCMSGYNSCMFAYGQTGSGKTHTMLGDIGDLDQQPSESRGMTPRVFEYLFVRIQKEEESRRHERLKYICKCSFLEIYNEQITDLLEPSSTNLQLREDAKKGVYVENLTEIEVTSVQDVMKLLLQGSCNRKVAATNMNRESSRSHSVFTCIIESKWEHDSVINTRFGRLNLVDLAGSERQKTSGAEGDRLKEAANINKSLSTLGLVIMVLVDIANGKQRHVPYRDSKLTFLLQDSLGGNSKTTIIATVSPSYCCSMETLSTLKFAQRAKFIRNNAVVNEDTSGDVVALRQQIQQLKEEVYCLRRQALGQFSSVGQLNKLVDASYATLDPEMADCSVGDIENSTKKMKRLDALLSGSLRREQSAEKTSKMLAEEIEQLNILVRQREDDTQCGKMMLRFREDKIRRLESLSHGLISADTFLADENRALSEELQLLRNSIDRNPQLTRFAMENIRLMEQLRKFQDFYDRGERETMLEEISNLRDQLSELLDQKLLNTEQPPEFAEAVQENKLLRNEVSKYQSEIEELKASLKRFQEENNQYSRQAGDLELKLSTLRTEYEEQQSLLQVLNREVISENKHGLEDQNQLLMSELETLLEQHQKIRDSLTEVEHRERYFKKKLRLLQKELVKERELHNLEKEVANRSEDDNNVMLEEKLERTRKELEEAQKRNIIFQGEEACRMATEQEMDLMRTEVEAETADVIASMHSELQAMRAQLAVALEHENLTQERVVVIMSELDQTKQNLDALSKENARLLEKHEIMLHGKDSEIQELRKNWEEATVRLIDYLAEGDQALNAAAKEMEDIIEESFPNCVAHLPENNLRHAVSRIAQKQKVIEILQKKLQQAFEIAKDAECKIKSLNEEMDQQEMLSTYVKKMELLLSEKESEVLFCLSEKRAFETAISQYCDEIQHLKEKIQNKETELEAAHKELENSIHTQMAESETISQRDVKTMELLLATKENEVLSCLSEKSALETAMNHYCGEIQHLKEKLENKETELEVAHKELENSIHAQTVQKSECIPQNDAKKMELLLAEKESALVSCLSERQALETAIRQLSDEIQRLKKNIQNKETELEAAHKELENHIQTQMDKKSESISQIDVYEMQLEDLRNSLNLAKLDVAEKRSEAAALLGKLEESQAMFKEAQMLVDALVSANESAKRDAEWWKAELQKLILLQVNSLPEWDSLRTELDELKLSFSAQHDPSEMGEESISKKTDLPENSDVISKYADMISEIADEDTNPSKPLFLMENVITKFSTHMNALVVENTKLKEQIQEMLLTNKAIMNNLDQNHNLERELDSKMLELKKLEAQSADLKERAGELECKNILLEKELDEKSGMIGSLQSDIAEKTAQVESLQLVAKRVDQELLDSSMACQSMEAQLSEVKEIREDRDSLMAENANLRDQIELLSKRCSCLEVDLAERSHAMHNLQADLDVKIGEIQTMQNTINQVESREDRDSTMAENANMRDQMEVLSKRCSCLELDLAEKSHAMRVLQAELDAKTDEVQNMQTTINQVEADLTESSNALQILKDQLLDLQGNTNTVAEENFELKKQVDELQSRNSYLEEELDDKQYVIDSLEAELLELNPMLEQKIADSLKAINQELNAVERERDQLHAELVVANEQLEMVQGMVDEREAVAAEARHAAELSKTHAEEKEEETKLLERSVEELESTVNALENQVGIVKRETEMQRLLREDLEMEVQELKHQLSMAHAHTENIKQLESSLNDLGEKQERDSGNEIELLQLLDEVEKLHKEISNKDSQIKACKSHISELVAASGRQVSEHQKKIKELESMMEQLKPRVSTPSQKSEKSGGKLKGSGSPFSCMRLGMSQQVGSEIEEELLANKRRIEELEAIASARQKEVFMLNARLAEAESMTHDVVRDLLGVKTDITNYVALLGEKHHDSKEDEDFKNKAEVQKLRKQLNDFIAERESWLEEINKRQADMIAARMAAEKVRVRDQMLTEENEKLKVECAAQKKHVHDLEEEVKKLSGQQNLQQRIHHHAKIKDENNTLKVKNEDLSARLRRTELLLGRVNDELARYRTAEGKTPYINIDEEQQLKGKLQEAENDRLQMAQKLIKLCTSIMQAAGVNKFEAEADPSAAFGALKELEMRLVSTKQELEDLKFKSRLAGEKRRLSELKTSQSPMRSINFAAA